MSLPILVVSCPFGNNHSDKGYVLCFCLHLHDASDAFMNLLFIIKFSVEKHLISSAHFYLIGFVPLVITLLLQWLVVTHTRLLCLIFIVVLAGGNTLVLGSHISSCAHVEWEGPTSSSVTVPPPHKISWAPAIVHLSLLLEITNDRDAEIALGTWGGTSDQIHGIMSARLLTIELPQYIGWSYEFFVFRDDISQMNDLQIYSSLYIHIYLLYLF